MLIGFKIKNFLSFKELQHFSMAVGKTRSFKDHCYESDNIKLLKFSAIYGANASGKSNLIKALSFGKFIIFNGISSIDENIYFRLDSKYQKKPSYFEYELEKDGKLYSYGFEIIISEKRLVSEWLYDMSKSKIKKIFERDANKKTIVTELSKKDREFIRLDSCMLDMGNNTDTLFLTEMIRRLKMNNNESSYFDDFENVYQFLTNDLKLISPNVSRKIKFIYFEKHKEDIIPVLKEMGLGIDGIKNEESSIADIQKRLNKAEFDDFYKELLNMKKSANKIATARLGNRFYFITNGKEDFDVKVLKVKHNGSDVLFDTYEESDGTLRILELVDVLLSNNKVFIIDEIDRSLHPELTKEFVKMFLKICGDKHIQLIVTTHDVGLLNYEIIRRDEIWFAEKNNGATELYSLEEFKNDARFDRRIDKAYLDGRYGAVPDFSRNE